MLLWTTKTKHPASDGKEFGKYRFYTSSEKIKRVDFCDVKNKKSLIIGNGGKGGIFLDTNFSASDHMFVLNSASEKYIDYIYNYLKNTWTIFLDNCYNGSTIGNISKNTFNEYKIPFPKKEMMTKFEPVLTKLMKLHERQQELYDEIPEKETEICEMIKKLTRDSDNYENVKFGNITEFQKKTKKYKMSDAKETGKYKFYTSSQEKILFIDEEPLFKKEMLIMGRKGNISIHYDTNFSCEHDDVYVVWSKYLKYIYYFVKLNVSTLKDQMKGSTVKGISKETLNEFEIKLLHKDLIKSKLQPLFDEVDELKEELEENKQKHTELSIKFMKMIDPNYGKVEALDEDGSESSGSESESDDE